MKLPSSLTSRLVLTAVGLVALVSILVSVVTTLGMRAVLTSRLDEDIRGFVGGPGGAGPRVGLRADFDSDGNGSGSYRPQRSELEVRILTPAQLDALAKVRVDGEVHEVDAPGLGNFRVIARPGVDPRTGATGTIVTGQSTEEIDDTLSTLVFWELLLGALGVLLAFGASLLLVRRTLAPLREVAAVARDVTRLDLARGRVGETVRVPERLTDESTEVGQVGASLNSLLTHMEQALDAREHSEQRLRQFVADASHELRTPLTTIRGYAELAGRSPDALATSMAKVSEESLRMSSLVDDLLLLARLDSGRPLNAEPVDLTQLLISAVDDARVVDPSRTWALALPPEPVVVTGDEQRLHQVVTNLLGNARRHTPPGTVVTAGLTADPVTLRVHDTGPGLPEDLQVFERFTRGDSSRTRASGGAGLGLSLVAAIATAHGGRVAAVSKPGDTTFTVTLPVDAGSTSDRQPDGVGSSAPPFP